MNWITYQFVYRPLRDGMYQGRRRTQCPGNQGHRHARSRVELQGKMNIDLVRFSKRENYYETPFYHHFPG